VAQQHQDPLERKFDDAPGVRKDTPIIVGLVAPSSGGKSLSALRLATGMQEITGGDIWALDTEADRLLHYAPTAGQKANPKTFTFNFRHVAFRAPFGPLDYLAAVRHCVAKGAKTIIGDSMSHMHEGPGGTLEAHEAECDRLVKEWRMTYEGGRDKVKMSAWQRPKAELRQFLNEILQLRVNFIFCYRAKEKMKIKTGEQPKPLGFMPIAGDEMIFEATINMLLYPNSGGVPTWHSEEMGERAIVKQPEWSKPIFAKPRPLDEQHGREIAEWAAGAGKGAPTDKAQPAKAAPPSEGAAREIAEAMKSLRWSRDVSAAWLREIFGADGIGALSPDQLADARELLIDRQIGEDVYQQRLDGLRAKRRVK
jgi:hypothetical protein